MQKLIDKWKETELPQFCRECGGECCNRNLTGLTEENVTDIFGKRRDRKNAYGAPVLILKEDGWQTNHAMGHYCPQLKKGLCSIYEKRPQICRDFPVIWGEFDGVYILVLDEKCPATSNIRNVRYLCRKALELGGDVDFNFREDGLTEQEFSEIFED